MVGTVRGRPICRPADRPGGDFDARESCRDVVTRPQWTVHCGRSCGRQCRGELLAQHGTTTDASRIGSDRVAVRSCCGARRCLDCWRAPQVGACSAWVVFPSAPGVAQRMTWGGGYRSRPAGPHRLGTVGPERATALRGHRNGAARRASVTECGRGPSATGAVWSWRARCSRRDGARLALAITNQLANTSQVSTAIASPATRRSNPARSSRPAASTASTSTAATATTRRGPCLPVTRARAYLACLDRPFPSRSRASDAVPPRCA
jgi:hypothetical protein